MDKDTFAENPEAELTALLAEVIRKVAVAGKTYDSIIDSNGSKVGKWEILDLQGR